MNIFEIMYPKFTFTKKTITLFEAFAGIGSQHIALKQLSNEFNFTLDCVGISEIDKYAIKAYNAIHGEVKNYGSICDIQEIPQVDIFTYSFPCQDISLAGNQKGFSKGSGTRSGLLWEVERLLENQEKIGKLPQVLLMENVKALVGMKFKDDYIEWQLKLESLGYRNYWEILNAKNYGIPQNRERVFMVSILGEYHYTFPKPFPLKLRLKDMLEDEVDEKYYLSDKMIKGMQNTKFNSYSLDTKLKDVDDIAATIIARFEGTPQVIKETSQTLCLNSKVDGKQPSLQDRVYDSKGVSTAVTTSFMPSILIPEATKKGYAEATNGDGVYINRPHQKRGVVQKGMIQTIKTSPDIGVVVKTNKIIKKGSYNPSGYSSGIVVDEKGIAPTVMENHGTVTAVEVTIYDDYNSKIKKDQDVIGTVTPNFGNLAPRNGTKIIIGSTQKNASVRKDGISPSLTSAMGMGGGQTPIHNYDLRIRKLTPKECYRLMGFNDEDFNKAASVISNSQLYKTAGNSIVVDVLYYIFKGLFNNV